jgi:hypothetical protein
LGLTVFLYYKAAKGAKNAEVEAHGCLVVVERKFLLDLFSNSI